MIKYLGVYQKMTDYEIKYKIANQLIENGYLIHCSDAIFDNFDEKYIVGNHRAHEGYGFYFSDMPYKSINYGENFYIIKKDNLQKKQN